MCCISANEKRSYTILYLSDLDCYMACTINDLLLLRPVPVNGEQFLGLRVVELHMPHILAVTDIYRFVLASFQISQQLSVPRHCRGRIILYVFYNFFVSKLKPCKELQCAQKAGIQVQGYEFLYRVFLGDIENPRTFNVLMWKHKQNGGHLL